AVGDRDHRARRRRGSQGFPVRVLGRGPSSGHHAVWWLAGLPREPGRLGSPARTQAGSTPPSTSVGKGELVMNARFSFLFVSVGLALISAASLSGCSGGPASNDALTVGFIYIGAKDDFGYNQAHAEGAAAVKHMPGIKVVEEERVPDTVEVQKTMKGM